MSSLFYTSIARFLVWACDPWREKAKPDIQIQVGAMIRRAAETPALEWYGFGFSLIFLALTWQYTNAVSKERKAYVKASHH